MASYFVELRISERYTRYEIAPSITVVKLPAIFEGFRAYICFTSSNVRGFYDFGQ
jgi:hypothetical protein